MVSLDLLFINIYEICGRHYLLTATFGMMPVKGYRHTYVCTQTIEFPPSL